MSTRLDSAPERIHDLLDTRGVWMRPDDIAEQLNIKPATVRQALNRRRDLFRSKPDPTDPQEQRLLWHTIDHWWNRNDDLDDDQEHTMPNPIDPQPDDTYETYATRVLGLIDGACPTCGHEQTVSYRAIGLAIRPESTGTNWSKPAVLRICTNPKFDEVRAVVERTDLSYEDAAEALAHLGGLLNA